MSNPIKKPPTMYTHIQSRAGAILAAILASCLAGQAAPLQVWNDDFSAVTLNSNLIDPGGTGTVSQSGGNLVLDTGGTGGFLRDGVYTNTDQTGALTQFNGAPLYDFTSHAVSVQLDIASITGAPGGGRNVFFLSVGDDQIGDATLLNPANGVIVRLEQLDSGGTPYWRMNVATRVDNIQTELVYGLGALPTSLTCLFGKQALAIDVGGTTFSGGATRQLVALPDLSAITNWQIGLGVHNVQNVVEQTVASLSSFAVTVGTPQQVWDDDFSAATRNPNLIVGGGTGFVSQSAGKLIIDSNGTGSDFRYGVYTNTDQTGALTEFNGAPLYDFYDHPVIIDLGIASIAGVPLESSRNVFCLTVGDNSQNASGYFLFPNNGVVVRLERLIAGSEDNQPYWRMLVNSSIGSSQTTLLFAGLAGAPTSLTCLFDQQTLTIDVAGTTFSGGATQQIVALPDLSAAISNWQIGLGVQNVGTVAEQTVASIDWFTATVGVIDAPLYITNVMRDGSGNFIMDFTGSPMTTYKVTKSPDLQVPFGPLTVPLNTTTNSAGIGQAVVPAAEASEPKEFYRIETLP